jgi:hypothetical protein
VLDHKQTFGLSRYYVLFFYPSGSYFTSLYTSTQVAYVWSEVTQRGAIRANEANSWALLVAAVYGIKT